MSFRPGDTYAAVAARDAPPVAVGDGGPVHAAPTRPRGPLSSLYAAPTASEAAKPTVVVPRGPLVRASALALEAFAAPAVALEAHAVRAPLASLLRQTAVAICPPCSVDRPPGDCTPRSPARSPGLIAGPALCKSRLSWALRVYRGSLRGIGSRCRLRRARRRPASRLPSSPARPPSDCTPRSPARSPGLIAGQALCKPRNSWTLRLYRGGPCGIGSPGRLRRAPRRPASCLPCSPARPPGDCTPRPTWTTRRTRASVRPASQPHRCHPATSRPRDGSGTRRCLSTRCNPNIAERPRSPTGCWRGLPHCTTAGRPEEEGLCPSSPS
jgi:hypothetical protein